MAKLSSDRCYAEFFKPRLQTEAQSFVPLTNMDAHESTAAPEGEDHAALLDNAAALASEDIADNVLGPLNEAPGDVATHDFQDYQQEVLTLERSCLLGTDVSTTSLSYDHRPAATRTNSYESSGGLENVDMRHRTTWPRNETGTYLPLRERTDII